MGKGYIGITDREWFEFLKDSEGLREINFWRKNTNKFRSLEAGETFFFLVKNEKGVSEERKVLGFATYDRYEVLSINDAWEKYKSGNGTATKEIFIKRMRKVYKEDISTSEIGCIILKDMVVFQNGVKLSDVDIDFQSSIVSGKGISEGEAFNIIYDGSEEAEIINTEIIMEYGESYFAEEGSRVLVEHLKRERDKKVIKIAKSEFVRRHGRLYCEVCGFDFDRVYGQFGQGYIEGHHNKPLSEYSEGDVTRVEDIVMLCANCHRVIHRNNLEVNELKDYLHNN